MAIAPQLQQRLPFVDKEGRLTNEGLQTLNDAFAQIDLTLEQLSAVVGVDLPDLAAAAQAALDAADTANTAAAAAQGAADDTKRASDLASSYVDNPSPITVSDAGANVTVTVAAHNRIYGDGVSVAVAGGMVTGLSYNTNYFIYYDDPARTGGAVTYQAATDPADAAQLGDTHSVGVAPAIAMGAPDGTGYGATPPGGSYTDPAYL